MPDVTVERPTTEEALAEVSTRLGPDAEILSAQKVARGGIGGFFAREMVQIVARAAPEPPPPEPPPAPDGIAGVLDRLTRSAEDQEARFQDVLRRELSRELIDRATLAPAERSEGGAGHLRHHNLLAPDPPAPPGMGPPAWSVERLRQLGIPARLVAAVDGQHPADDGAWLQWLAAAAAPLLGPLPGQPVRYVGPGAPRLTAVLGVTAEAGEGPAHLVLGGGDWRGLGVDAPAAVSWASDGGVADALGVAARTGCPLAFGSTGGFPVDIVRLGPLDVALAIRRLVGRT